MTISILLDGPPDMNVTTTWPNTRAWLHESIQLAQKYRSKVPRATIRSLWPNLHSDSGVAPSSEPGGRRLREPATLRGFLRDLWRLIKFAIRLVVIAYVGLSIFADTRDGSVRAAVLDIDAFVRRNKNTLDEVFSTIVVGACCFLILFFLALGAKDWDSKRRTAVPIWLPRERDIRLSVEVFLHSPGSWRRLKKALEHGLASRTRDTAIEARETRLLNDLA
ncbi:hypothetical protein [Kribbella kalugense]|uniref:Uncharacterized protein n=1 Tax=Kribbella kalugense TaxID=2512221 RepID=A0A4R7ZDB2_9ACTN|nr:hypothetical protein [Kribbella kalugense]TDW14108.1 hypothetical protein EV650_7691 [Kribbella kalugense]